MVRQCNCLPGIPRPLVVNRGDENRQRMLKRVPFPLDYRRFATVALSILYLWLRVGLALPSVSSSIPSHEREHP